MTPPANSCKQDSNSKHQRGRHTLVAFGGVTDLISYLLGGLLDLSRGLVDLPSCLRRSLSVKAADRPSQGVFATVSDDGVDFFLAVHSGPVEQRASDGRRNGTLRNFDIVRTFFLETAP